MTVVILMAVGLRGFVGRIAIFLGLIFGYLLSWLFDVIFGEITSVLPGAAEAADPRPGQLDRCQGRRLVRLPGHTADGLVGNQAVTPGRPRSAWHLPRFSIIFVLLVLPAVIALVAENIGHVKAVAGMTGDDLDPVMGRAVAADGVATVIASSVGGSPTTTYAENIGVMAATRVYSTAAYFVAAIVAILLGLVPKFGAIVNADPGWRARRHHAGALRDDRPRSVPRSGSRTTSTSPTRPTWSPISAGLILGIGYGTTGFFEITDDFQLGGIALGTIVIVAGYHLARVVAPPDADGTMMAVGSPGSTSRITRTAPPRAAPPRTTRRRSVKPAPFAYLRPGSLADALAALAEAPNAKVLAGGQSLVPLLSMRLAAPGTLVDINGLPGLDRRHGHRGRASGSAPWPGTPTCWPRPTYAASSRS